MATFKSTKNSRLRSELDEFSKDMRLLQKKILPDVAACALQQTLEDAREDIQKELNASILGGPANTFFSQKAIAWNIGKLFSTQKGKQADRNAFTGSAFEGGLKRGFIFIQEVQAKILEPSLEGKTISQLEYTSGRKQDPYVLPRNFKNIKGDKKLVLRRNKRGNVTGFKKGSLGRLKEAARKKTKGNPRYFEIKRDTITPNNLKLKAGIYRSDRNKKGVSNLRAIVFYKERLTYKKKQFNFDQLAVSSFNRNFTKNMNRCLDKKMQKFK